MKELSHLKNLKERLKDMGKGAAHLLRDLRNIASSFISEVGDKLQMKKQHLSDRTKHLFRNLFRA